MNPDEVFAVIRFQCPACRSVLQASPAHAGSVIACSHCRKPLQVPVPAALVAIPRQPPPPLPPATGTDLVFDHTSAAPRRPRQQPQPSKGGILLVAGIALSLLLAVGGGVAAFLAWGQAGQGKKREPVSEVTPKKKPLAKSTPEKKPDSPRPDPTPEDNAPPGSTEEPAKKPTPKKKDPPKAVTEVDKDWNTLQPRVLEALNARRKKAGVPAVTLHAKNSQGCREHALYLITNGQAAALKGAHDQDSSLPGATAAGKAAAIAASVVSGEPLTALNTFLDAPAHRAILLDRALKSVALGWARNKAGQWISVLDFTRGGQGTPGVGGASFVLYPVHKQTGVQLAFPGNEIPDPLPDASNKLAGYPITATFTQRAAITQAKARLEDETGNEVPVFFSSPEKPANRRYPRHQAGTLCLFARKVLKPGTRYTVHMQARLGKMNWSRAWTFVTQSEADVQAQMIDRAVARLNRFRKAAGLKPASVSSSSRKACQAHADYLALHLDRVNGLRLDEERTDLEGYTREGRDIARKAAVRVGGGSGPIDAIDWMLASVLNRNLILNPGLDEIGLGAALQAPRGWIWVYDLARSRRKGDIQGAILFPGKGMKEVPLHFGREISGLVTGQSRDNPKGAKQGKQTPGGFSVTATFAPFAPITGVTATLKDGTGTEVDCWQSTPGKPLPGAGTWNQIILVPKTPLKPATTYTAAMKATVDGKSWSQTWTFTTLDTTMYQQEVGTQLTKYVNQLRTIAGLKPVTLDAKLSRGCELHAKYVVRNLEHPKVQGLGIHEEDRTLPGATPEGAKAGEAGVIALISDPLDSVDGWMATLYHRIPLLDPALKRIGYGQELHPIKGWVTVLDAGNGR